VSTEGIPPFYSDYELIGWHANTKQMLKYYEKHKHRREGKRRTAKSCMRLLGNFVTFLSFN
jgi:hypothetical protein